MGPYSSIADLVRGFDSSVLQAAFQVPEEVIQSIKNATKQPLIIQDVSSQQQPGEVHSWEWEGRLVRRFMGLDGGKTENKKKEKESKAFNVYTADRDFENCNGWSLTVTHKDLAVLKDSNYGVFYVNLTKGAMMAPHWNPVATEIAFVVAGQGMVRVVCSSSEGNESAGCENQSFRVEEGDVFVVPRFHPMSQTSFNNDSFVFMGFSTTRKRNYPQYLVGKQSVFQVIDKDVLAAAFNVDNETTVQLWGQQEEALIVECTSCAEEQFSVWQEEVDRKREKEEEAKRREEEEARKREEEEEERHRREEEARKREEEERRQREEEAQHEEEERRQREKEARHKEEEKADQERRQREEEARHKEEERERKQQEEEGRGGGGGEEEEAARREEEERERREHEEHEGSRGYGGGGESEQETHEERQTRRRVRPKRQQAEEKERGRHEESEGEAAIREEEERIRREREQMRHARSEEPPIVLVDNLEKVMDILF